MSKLAEFRLAVSLRAHDSLEELVDTTATAEERAAFREMIAPAQELLTSGKRTRAALLYAGFRCQPGVDRAAPIGAGAALELYQASALVHDDVIDSSPTRRGKPAAHMAFAALHREREWEADPDAFGIAGAITVGDLLLSHSAVEFSRSIRPYSSPNALPMFLSMATEVAFGQYLDIRAENIPWARMPSAIESALSVIQHKSARYSVELPLALGALLAGASEQLIVQLRAIGGPLGMAFQLRDDYLGVFGDPVRTGKPAGGDITEGKRTALLALTQASASPEEWQWIDEVLGTPIEPTVLENVREIIVRSGALQAHEQIIADCEEAATRELAALSGVEAEGWKLLEELAEELRLRQS